jgi:propionyl-CoA carboxylase alpha chain
VAVHSWADRDEPHVREADEAVALPGSTPAESYLDINALLAAAKATGADAIHPGYGFLSESPSFARAVIESGLTWIGPDPTAIEVMGSKLESKRLMEQVGVPILPTIELSGRSTDSFADLPLGFPVLVKASAGGGGKGMRVVGDPDHLADEIAAARREAGGAFDDDTVFLEKYLNRPRHIEIQVFGDRHGNVVSMFERECSIQRRHQKIIEEAPSPAVDDETRRLLGETAVRAARAVEYVGAGTVEFLMEDDRFYFLEMNTRLQVEHPVTEMVTGIDLVRLQIEVADGAPIEAPHGMTGHAIEARLYAEDPANDFLPVTGTVDRFEIDTSVGLRVDSGIGDGSVISIHYDPMIAKVIAHAATRETAAALLADSLRRARIHGPITNRGLLVRILEHPEFLGGTIDTGFLDRHDVTELARPLLGPDEEWLAAVAAALADLAQARATTRTMTTIPAGWRNSPSQMQRRVYEGHYGHHEIDYRVTRDGLTVPGLGSTSVISASPGEVVLHTGEESRSFMVSRYGSMRHVDSDAGPARLLDLGRFPSSELDEAPGSLHAPMPGRVLRIAVDVGDNVGEGETLLVMEAMKMEHTLRSPRRGVVVEVRCRPGDQVDAGAVLIVVEEQ